MERKRGKEHGEGTGYTKGEEHVGMKFEFIDIKRAYLQADAKRDIYVELPQEDVEAGTCAKLVKAMSGTRDAAQHGKIRTESQTRNVLSRIGRPSPFRDVTSTEGDTTGGGAWG